jgi:hypothetical protein
MVNVCYRNFLGPNVSVRVLTSCLRHLAAHVSVVCSFRTGPTSCSSLQLKLRLRHVTHADAACYRNRMRVCATTCLACFETPKVKRDAAWNAALFGDRAASPFTAPLFRLCPIIASQGLGKPSRAAGTAPRPKPADDTLCSTEPAQNGISGPPIAARTGMSASRIPLFPKVAVCLAPGVIADRILL